MFPLPEYDSSFKSGEDTYKRAIVDSWLLTIVAKNRLQRTYVFGGASLFKALGDFLESFSNFFDLTEPYINDTKMKKQVTEFISDFHDDRNRITLARIKDIFGKYATQCKRQNLIGEEGVVLNQGFDAVETLDDKK